MPLAPRPCSMHLDKPTASPARPFWSDADLDTLVALYATTPLPELMRRIGRSRRAIQHAAHRLRLVKVIRSPQVRTAPTRTRAAPKPRTRKPKPKPAPKMANETRNTPVANARAVAKRRPQLTKSAADAAKVAARHAAPTVPVWNDHPVRGYHTYPLVSRLLADPARRKASGYREDYLRSLLPTAA